MAIKINSAFRLHKNLKEALNLQGNKRSLEVWAEVFGINGSEQSIDKQFETIDLFKLLCEEYFSTLEKLKNSDLSQHLYKDAFDSIIHVLTINSLVTGVWDHYKSNLKPEAMITLAWCCEHLPEEELLISSDELIKLQKETNDYWEEIEKSDIAIELKMFISSQVQIIQKAILEYKIIGLRAFNNAQYSIIADTLKRKEDIKNYKEETKLKPLWEKWKTILSLINDHTKPVLALKAATDLLNLFSQSN